MTMIYHMTTFDAWEAAESSGAYTAPSLEQEGFIHFSKQHQIVPVANFIYNGRDDMVLLVVDESKLDAELKYEPPAHPDPNNPVPVDENDSFPHLYGFLNLDAVVRVVAFPCQDDGTFSLPPEIVS